MQAQWCLRLVLEVRARLLMACALEVCHSTKPSQPLLKLTQGALRHPRPRHHLRQLARLAELRIRLVATQWLAIRLVGQLAHQQQPQQLTHLVEQPPRQQHLK